jgi:hypothetical protein
MESLASAPDWWCGWRSPGEDFSEISSVGFIHFREVVAGVGAVGVEKGANH